MRTERPCSHTSYEYPHSPYNIIPACRHKHYNTTFMALQHSFNDSFWHIVTETVFYYNKLHLTEKIFKPIIARRPFLLLSAPGNLAYLKSYGFKTFDCWWDESYDNYQNYDRIREIYKVISFIDKCSDNELQSMYNDMTDTLEYNYNRLLELNRK